MYSFYLTLPNKYDIILFLLLIAFFRDRNVEKRIRIYEDENVIPYNGFSFYKIAYKGEYPESILRAYCKLDEYNSEAPRKNIGSNEGKIEEQLKGGSKNSFFLIFFERISPLLYRQ